jgi:hypothetical protein
MRKIVIIIVLTVLFIGGWLFFSDQKRTAQQNKAQTSEDSFESRWKTPAEAAVFLERNIKVKIPPVTQKTALSQSKLPASLQFLLTGKETGVQTFIVKFGDASEGYMATFNYPGDKPSDYYYHFMQLIAEKYQVIESARVDQAGILYVENNDYVFRLETLQGSDNSTDASITMLSK